MNTKNISDAQIDAFLAAMRSVGDAVFSLGADECQYHAGIMSDEDRSKFEQSFADDPEELEELRSLRLDLAPMLQPEKIEARDQRLRLERKAFFERSKNGTEEAREGKPVSAASGTKDSPSVLNRIGRKLKFTTQAASSAAAALRGKAIQLIHAEFIGALAPALAGGKSRTCLHKMEIDTPSGHGKATLHFTELDEGTRVTAEAPLDCAGRTLRFPAFEKDYDMVFAEEDGWATAEVFIPLEAVKDAKVNQAVEAEWV